jgi:uncharacterized protein (TIGR02246 family)
MNIGQARVDINSKKEALKDAISRAEAAAVASFYADDAVVLPPSGRIYRGKKDIRRMWRLMMRNGLKEFSISTRELRADGNVAYEFGQVSVDVENDDGKQPFIESAKYVAVWRHSPEGWKLHRHIWNTNAPPEQA